MRLPEKAFQLLAALLERLGRVITREELRAKALDVCVAEVYEYVLRNKVNRN